MAAERPYPGSMIHVDVKKLGNIPDGGGWRYVSRQQGLRNRATTNQNRRTGHTRGLGQAFVHTVIDDHSRVAYAEIHDHEKAPTAAGVLIRAVQWYARRGITIERVLSDNGPAYRSKLWHTACQQLQITPKKTRPYRPQTNSKIERSHRTLTDGWAHARCYQSETQTRQALPAWLHHYNHHRPHTATRNLPPFTRLTNVPGQYT